MTFSAHDREILRELARRHAELAHSPRNRQLISDWTAYGASPTQDGRTLIRIEINTFEHELLPALMRCEDPEARDMEAQLLRPMVNFTEFEDDTIVPDYFGVGDASEFIPFGLPVKRQESGGLGHHFIPYLHDLEEDGHLLQRSHIALREDLAQSRLRLAQDTFGDVLPVRRISNALYSVPMQDVVHIMNMDDLYIAMVDDEDRFRAMLDRLADDYIALFRAMEQSGNLRSAASMQHLCQGTYCFTGELADDKPGASLTDTWLYMDAQEASGISPAMFRDLVFPAYKRIMDCFGLVSYGCCEAVHGIWDDCLAKVSNLRKVSISPWCDEEFMGERLRGTGITYLRKPPATLLGMDTPILDEDAVTACFRKTAQASRGCKREIIQRDVYQVGSSPEKVRRYVSIIRREMDK